MAIVGIFMLMLLSACGNKTTNISSSVEKLEVTVWNTQGTDYTATEISENIVDKWLFDKTNVRVKNIYGNDGGQWDAKLAKLVAGNNMPEIVACGAYQGPAHFSKLNELNMVWELTPEMIQTYAPEVWKKTPARFWENIKVNGKIFGIPFYGEYSKETMPDLSDDEINFIKDMTNVPRNDTTIAGPQTLYVRDDILKMFYPSAKSYDELVALLDEKGKPIGEELCDIPILTTDDYVDFMYNIKNANIKENGKTVFAFGYSGSDNWDALSLLGADMCGYKGHYYTGTWNDVQKRIEILLTHDIVKGAAKIQNKMIGDKVIDPSSLAHTAAIAKEKVLNGQYAIAPLDSIVDVTIVNQQLEELGRNYRYRPFYTQVKPQPEYQPFYEEQLWSESMCILKSVDEQQLKQILGWINAQYTDEYQDIKYWGPKEAGLYKETQDGKREFADERFTKYFVDGDATALTLEETKGLGVGGLYNVGATVISEWKPQIYLKIEKYKPSPWSGFKFSSSSEHVTSLKKYPACQGWSSIYADIPETITFWAAREQWENLFKRALVVPPSEFDAKWDDAIVQLNNIVNIPEMERKMTEIAKPLAENLMEDN